MEQKKRNTIALVFFIGLLCLGFVALLWYIFIGHSWNIAASRLDDAFSSLNGYATIVFEGVAEPQDDGEADGSGSAKAVDIVAGLDTDAETAPQVASEYASKGASVFLLDTQNPQKYADGQIIKRSPWKMGVLSVSEEQSTAEARALVSYLRARNVDYVVVLADSLDNLAGVEGINAVILLQPLPDAAAADGSASGKEADGSGEADEEPAASAEQDDAASRASEAQSQAYCFESPQKGSIGVLLIASSKVTVSKVV